MTGCWIYGLTDPRTGEVRYVGKTWGALKKRRRSHVKNASYLKTHKDRWIVSLLKDGIEPGIVVLEECNREGWQARERHWIASLRADGVRLTNGTDGGDGNQGIVFSEETRRRLSEASKGRRHTPEARALMSTAAKGRVISREQRESISRALLGRPHTDAQRDKHLSSYTDEVREKMRTRQAARWARTSDEERSIAASKTQLGLTKSGLGLVDAPKPHAVVVDVNCGT